MAQANKLCSANPKGGVGKTATAINVAGALSERGNDVLFVDLDPQGNATECLGMMDAYDESPPSLFDALVESEHRDAMEDIIRKHEEMDVVPSNIDMTAAEAELTLSRRSGERLDLALQQVEDDYDFILVDCPPNLGNLMDNALFATRNVLMPALAESTSKRAFELMFDQIESLELDFEISIDEVGVVINRIDVRKSQAQDMIDWVEAAFEDVPVWQVRERADIQKALDAGVSLVQFNPESDMADVYREVASDLEDYYGGELNE